MFATFRLEAPLPFTGGPASPLYTPEEVDAFVDRYRAPRALRDPFSQRLLRRPVALRLQNDDVENICVEESSLRHVYRESNGTQSGYALASPLSSATVILHRPMCRQLSSFYDAALQNARIRHGERSSRFAAVRDYVDAALYELHQPVAPLTLPQERAQLAHQALVPLRRANSVAEILRVRVEHLLPQLTDPRNPITRLEKRRRALLLHLRGLRVDMREARVTFWRVVTPPTQASATFVSEWREIYTALKMSAQMFEEVLSVEIPASLMIRAGRQMASAQTALRGPQDARAGSPEELSE